MKYIMKNAERKGESSGRAMEVQVQKYSVNILHKLKYSYPNQDININMHY